MIGGYLINYLQATIVFPSSLRLSMIYPLLVSIHTNRRCSVLTFEVPVPGIVPRVLLCGEKPAMWSYGTSTYRTIGRPDPILYSYQSYIAAVSSLSCAARSNQRRPLAGCERTTGSPDKFRGWFFGGLGQHDVEKLRFKTPRLRSFLAGLCQVFPISLISAVVMRLPATR